ncbi:putative AAA family ATPase [Fusobacterium phage vB_FnuS_FNU4]|nr:putative AAA family ATPase [Fusobacterium phage vB_FnuS_FNU4]
MKKMSNKIYREIRICIL